jgi:hypothetical protein
VTVKASRALLAAALFAALLPRVILAQEAAPLIPEDPRAPRFREVERGPFAGFELGWMAFFKTPTAEPSRYPSAGSGGGVAQGTSLGLLVGSELGDRLAVALLLLGANQQASISYGAFSLAGAGADVRLNFSRRQDGQGVPRLVFYAHLRGAFYLTEPHGLFGKTGTLAGGGLGLEYATRLRHFSVGLALDGVYALQAKSPGIAVLPGLRYTF